MHKRGSASSMSETEMESRGSMISIPELAEAASASLAPQLKALQEDIANLKEVQRQNAEMMGLLAKHEAHLAEMLRARARRSSGGTGRLSAQWPSSRTLR